MRKLVNGHPM